MTRFGRSLRFPREPRPPTSTLFTYTTLFRSRIAVLMGGNVRQLGTAAEVFSSPVDSEVASFVGEEKTSADRKGTRLNSSHRCISYAVFCVKTPMKFNSPAWNCTRGRQMAVHY